jgi:phosphonate transport system substrate-binding protein
MTSTIWLGAVAYDPKVVTIWEGMKRYFREEAKVDLEVVLFLSYEAQVAALLGDAGAPLIDIAWNTNLAYLQSARFSAGKCAPIAMRDTDREWFTKIIALKGGPVRSVDDLRGRSIALGSRDSGHAAILPVHFLEQQGLTEGKDYRSIRFDSDVGKHGDTGASELEVLKAVLEGKADAGAVGSPFWEGILAKKLVPAGAVVDVWTSPSFSHCMFTAKVGLGADVIERFKKALFGMRWENPAHRPVLEAEGLKEWLPPLATGYASLEAAGERQGFFKRK